MVASYTLKLYLKHRSYEGGWIDAANRVARDLASLMDGVLQQAPIQQGEIECLEYVITVNSAADYSGSVGSYIAQQRERGGLFKAHAPLGELYSFVEKM